MVNSYYKCECAGRTVTVWPCITGEAAFYDVVISDFGQTEPRTVTRLTVREAACYVITELGAPVATTVDVLAGMIGRWRVEFEQQEREPGNRVVTDVNSRDHVSAWASGR